MYFEFLIQHQMKKYFITILVLCFTFTVTGQDERSIAEDEWVLSVGLNTINSLGTKNPFADPGDWAFKTPLTASIETRWNDTFTIELGFSLNGFEEGKRLDAAGAPTQDESYFSIDTALKYYFGESLFPDEDWIDFYGSAGLGFFSLDDSNVSINAGGGVIFWLGRNNDYGIKLQGLGKFAINHSNSGQIYPNNHFQYSLTALFRL